MVEPEAEPEEGGDGRPLASALRRLLARVIDVLIVGVAMSVFLSVTMADELNDRDLDPADPSWTRVALLIIAATGVYEIVMVAVRGQTLGKMATGIAVVRVADGGLPTWGQSALRWAVPAGLALVPFIPLLPVVDAAWLLWDKDRQCLHDKAASTLVVQ